MTKVIVPYVADRLHSVTRAVLQSYNLDTTFHDLGDDPFAYWRLLRSLWLAGETVCIVEQDVVPWPGLLEEMDGCCGMWCTCTYRYGFGYGLYHMLGCTKLSDDLMKQTAGVWDEPVKWDVCDGHLLRAAQRVDLEPHPHRPPCIHLSEKEIGPTNG